MTEREAKAMGTVKKYSTINAVAGFLPIPLADIVAVTGVQLKMLSDLAKIYGVPFKKDQGKAFVSSLLAGLATPGLGAALGSIVKVVPVAGPIVGAFTIPVFASAATYAVGRVFVTHFESGGTFLDFDPDKVRAHFAQEFEKGKATASSKSSAA